MPVDTKKDIDRWPFFSIIYPTKTRKDRFVSFLTRNKDVFPLAIPVPCSPDREIHMGTEDSGWFVKKQRLAHSTIDCTVVNTRNQHLEFIRMLPGISRIPNNWNRRSRTVLFYAFETSGSWQRLIDQECRRSISKRKREEIFQGVRWLENGNGEKYEFDDRFFSYLDWERKTILRWSQRSWCQGSRQNTDEQRNKT